MFRIVVSDKLSQNGLDQLESRANVLTDYCPGLDPRELAGRLSQAEGLIVRSGTKVTSELLATAPQLRVIGRAGIGVDNIDVQAATERGIVVLNTPDANATTTAELTIAHVLSLSRHLPAADRSVRAGEWNRSAFVGTEVAGKTLGIIGFGTIGRIVAARAQGLGMRVVAHDPFVTHEAFEQASVEPLELELLLQQADYVTLHCPQTDATRGFFDERRIGSMKKGARLINCARGGLVDERALVSALETGHLSGAAIDVFEREPPTGSRLLELPAVVVTPHLGASTREAQTAVALAIVRQVVQFLETGEAVNAVNLPPVSSEELRRLRPYQSLAERLGRLVGYLVGGALDRLEVGLYGRAAEVDSHPVAIEALVGLLRGRLDAPVNRVNALHLARRHGIELVETHSEAAHDYVSLITVSARHQGQLTSVAGTLLGERHPRLVRIDDFEIEAIPQGTLLLTQHDDRPGVIGAIGTLLGTQSVNISRMHVGVRGDGEGAIAILEVSRPLDREILEQIRRIDAIHSLLQVTL